MGDEIYLTKYKSDENTTISIKDMINYSITNDLIDILKFLVANHINISIYLDNALYLAVSMDNYSIVKYLLSLGAEPNSEALIQSVFLGNLEIVKSLVNGGANVNTYKNEPIRIAIDFNFTDIIEFLLDNGVSYTIYKKELLFKNQGSNLVKLSKKTLFERIKAFTIYFRK